jgi:hypothetical protein
MKRGAVVTGTVYDQDGQPLAGVRVSVMQERLNFRTGVRSLESVASPDLGMTDNRGVYRIYGLAPGTYLVMADVLAPPFRLPNEAEWKWADSAVSASPPPEPDRPRRYAPVFHPGTPVQARAAAVTLNAGDERAGIDIRVETMTVASIVGTIQAADPAWIRDAILIAMDLGASRVVAQARADAAGQFTMTNVAPGSYIVVAGPGARAGARFWGSSGVTVAGGDQTVSVSLELGVDVKGRVVTSAADQVQPDLTRARISLIPVSREGQLFGQPGVQPSASGEFTFSSVAPGSYRISATLPSAAPGTTWTAASAMVQDRDALDVPITVGAGSPIEAVVTFTARETAIGGTLTDASGRPAPDYFVIAFPADRALWIAGSRRIASGRPGIDGRYRLNLPPGNYVVAAVTDVEPFQWFDAVFLSELLPFGINLTLGEGQVVTQDLRLGGR